MKKKILVLIVLLAVSCVKSDDGSLTQFEIEKYKINALQSNDVDSYTRLLLHFDNIGKYYEMLPYSILIAKKYKNPDAYYDVYRSIIRINNDGNFNEKLIENLKEVDKNFSLYYLIEGSKLNDVDCKVALAKHYRFGYGVIKNLKKSDSLFNSIKQN